MLSGEYECFTFYVRYVKKITVQSNANKIFILLQNVNSFIIFNAFKKFILF